VSARVHVESAGVTEDPAAERDFIDSGVEAAVPGDEKKELSDEELEEARKAFRYRLVQVAEGIGWGIQLDGEDIVLGAGHVSLRALLDERVMLYGHIEKPAFEPTDVPQINVDAPLGCFLSQYEAASGRTNWGVFHRLCLPRDPISNEELGRWLDVAIIDIIHALEFWDESFEKAGA
jgi:hypothetical protein